MPRRESERKSHPLACRSDILQAVESRLSMLRMTYTKYIEVKLICFIPGKVLDEIKRLLNLVESNGPFPSVYELIQELRDLSRMAMEHFEENFLSKYRELLEHKLIRERDSYLSHSASTNAMMLSAFANEIIRIKKDMLRHKDLLIEMTSVNQNVLSLKLRKQNILILVQNYKIAEQERKIAEQNVRLVEQEATLAEMKAQMNEWNRKYEDLMNAFKPDGIDRLMKSNFGESSSVINPYTIHSTGRDENNTTATYKSNIKPRTASILPKSCINPDRKRKRRLIMESLMPVKKTRISNNLNCPKFNNLTEKNIESTTVSNSNADEDVLIVKADDVLELPPKMDEFKRAKRARDYLEAFLNSTRKRRS